MVTKKKQVQDPAEDPTVGLASVNEVHLVGRISAAPVDREMPSGDVLTRFRVVVHRLDAAGSGGRRRVDAIDCHTWSARTRKQAASWAVGDVVELRGALRRRFFRSGAGTQSMTEVEVLTAKMVRRGGSG